MVPKNPDKSSTLSNSNCLEGHKSNLTIKFIYLLITLHVKKNGTV